jgi:hypothetical protein
MKNITNKRIERATQPGLWDFGNKVLYDLCKNHPKHDDSGLIIAKIWLIGRSYAAAIERRRANLDKPGDDFYISKVAPAILGSDIDKWLEPLNRTGEITTNNIHEVLKIHSNLTNVFHSITGLEKRSLASKYLHFHHPNLFFIYDSRAQRAISQLSHYLGRAKRAENDVDQDYWKFTQKCIALRAFIGKEYSFNLTPRQLDNLLLEISG